jgi:hypothetical protein
LGLGHLIFGDLFLAEIRAYREKQMAETGLQPVFPLWGLPTARPHVSVCHSGHARHTPW